MKKLTNAIYLMHRWLGMVICLPVALWFATGMVMMYVGFPELSERERYAGLPNLEPETISHSPAMLIATVEANARIEALRLTSTGHRPLYLLKLGDGAWRGQYADSGEVVRDFSAESAVLAARHFHHTANPGRVTTQAHAQRLDMDQWTVSSALNDYRPLHRISMNDEAGTQLYVSARTGQVVRDTTNKERIWNWLGANLHWIYPFHLRKDVSLWRDVVITLALTGLITILSGAIIGFIQLRIRRRRERQSFSPYRGIAKYHHLLGLLGLIFLTTFMFSGLMSMGPWDLFKSRSNFSDQLERYQAGENSSRSALVYASVSDLRHLLSQEEYRGTKEIVWRWIGGESYITLHQSPSHQSYRLAVGDKETLVDKIQRGLGRLIPGSNVSNQQQLWDYDLYYYSHHDRLRPLPVLRTRHSDPESTWFHIDTTTGQLVERLTAKTRLERWLFNGLHSLDFPLLLNHRPAWDLVLLTLCTLGLFFSATSIILSWRYLGKSLNTLSDSSQNQG